MNAAVCNVDVSGTVDRNASCSRNLSKTKWGGNGAGRRYLTNRTVRAADVDVAERIAGHATRIEYCSAGRRSAIATRALPPGARNRGDVPGGRVDATNAFIQRIGDEDVSGHINGNAVRLNEDGMNGRGTVAASSATSDRGDFPGAGIQT